MGNHLHRLFAADGGVAAFVSALKSELPAAIQADARQVLRTYNANILRQDTTLAALRQLGERQKAAASLETQNSQEAGYYWLQAQLR